MKIDFEFDSKYGVFKDCIVLADDSDMTNIKIEEIKQQRFDNWLKVIELSMQTNTDAQG